MKRIRANLFGFLSLAIGVGVWRIYHSRERDRVPSPESMDSPAVAAAFNRIAGWPQMRLLRWYTLSRIMRMSPAGHAVDIGCGPGHLVCELARQAPALRITGIDLSDEVLAQAQAYAGQAGYGDRVAFEKGSAEAIPFPDGSLDLVVSTLSLHHWSRPSAVLDEVARVLRPGGAYVIFDLRRDMSPPFYLLLWFATRVVVPSALRVVNEPLGSRNAAYSASEATRMAADSHLTGWRISAGPLWLVIEGRKQVIKPRHEMAMPPKRSAAELK